MASSFPLTIPQASGPVFALDALTLERGLRAAKESPRRRIIMPLHRSNTEGVQRMLNFLHPGSYAQPHCHPAPENIESIAVLKGALGFLVFEPNGAVQSVHRLEAGNPVSCLVDIEPGVWHTIVALADDTVIFEIKRGPYNAASDKTFAAWAPAEGAADAADYLKKLESEFDG